MRGVLYFFIKSSWKQILIIALVSMVAAGLNILSLKYLKNIASADEGNRFYYLGIVAILISGSALAALVMENFSTRYFESLIVQYREKMARRILNANYESIENRLPRLPPVLMEEINEVGDFGKLIPAFIVALVQVIGILIYLAILSWQLSIVICLIFGAVILLMFVALPRVKKLKDKRSKTRFLLYAKLDQMHRGFKDLIVSRKHGDAFIQNGIGPPSLETSTHNGNIHMLKVSIEQIINVLLIVGFGFTLIYYFEWVELGSNIAIQFLALLLFVLPSFVKIIDFLNQLKTAENSLHQIDSLNANITKQVLVTKQQEVTYESESKEPLIALEDLVYYYHEREHGFRLGPLNLDIHDGNITIIKGGNGSGKTTLFNVISGLYTAKQGNLKFQGEQISDSNISSYRDLFSCYFTNSPVFDDMSYISEEQLAKADRLIKLLQLETKTGMSATKILETRLSFGQQGRLNLLRLLLEDRKIYMLDEWAANQDVHFKDIFYKEIVPDLKAKGKAVILISHDDRYHDIADQIVTMRNGQMEVGTLAV